MRRLLSRFGTTLTPAATKLGAGVLVILLATAVSTCRLTDLVNPDNPGTIDIDSLQVLDSAAVGSTALRTYGVTIEGGASSDPIPWSVRVARSSTWLKLPGLTGTAPGTYAVSFDPAGLAVGTYHDTLVFSVAGPTAEPVSVAIEFRITSCLVTDLVPSTSLTDALTTSDCAPPARNGRATKLYRFDGTINDSISVQMSSATLDAQVTIDTALGTPSIAQNDACAAGFPDACARYVRLPHTGSYIIEATTAAGSPAGAFRIDVTRPRAPLAPDTLRQFTDAIAPVAVGGLLVTATVNLRTGVDDPDGDSVRFQVEVQPVGTAFTNTPVSGPLQEVGGATIMVAGLTDDVGYHWQGRTIDKTGRTSSWVSFGANAETTMDFRVSIPQVPGAPGGAAQRASDGTTPIALGATYDEATALFEATLTDPDPTDQLRLEVEIQPVGTAFTNTASSASPAGAAGSVATATVGGLADNVAYHWQMRTVDQTGRASAWSSFGGNAESDTDFRVALRPTQLAIITQPTQTAAGATITPAVQVAAQDAGGNTLASYAGTVTIAIGTNPSAGVLSGTVSVASSAGIATFSGLSIDKTGAGYTLVATSGALNISSGSFDVTAASAVLLAFTASPAAAVAGASFSPDVEVTARDGQGNVATTFTGAVTLTLVANPGSAVLGGTTTANAVAGVATLAGLSINRTGSGYTLGASATGLASATSIAFDVTPAAATQLALVTPPSVGATSGAPLGIQPAVQLQDALGNAVAQAGVVVTASIASGAAGASLANVTATTDAAGLATFTTLTLSAVSGSYTLRFSAPNVTDATSGAITIGAGTASRIAMLTQPSAAAASGAAFAQQPAVQLLDASLNPVPQPGVVVTAQIASGGGTLGGTLTATTDNAGTGTFTNLSITGLAGSRTLTFTATNLLAVTSSAVVIGAGGATQVALQAGAGQSAIAGSAVAVAPSVIATDASGNPVAGVDVVFAVTAGNGSALPVAAVTTAANGIAAATSWTLGALVGVNTLTATSSGLTGSPVTFTATGVTGPPALFTKISGDNLTGPVGSTLGTALEVSITDANGNPVQGAPVTWAAATGGGSVNPTSSSTDVTGRATTSRTLHTVAGPHTTTATATINGLPAVLTFDATATVGGAASMVLVAGDAQTDTVGATLATPLTVRVTDVPGNPISGVVVSWSITGGGGSIVPTSSTTDALGIATASWTLGTATSAGSNTQSARATAAGPPVNFIATANPGNVNAAQTQVVVLPASITASNGSSASTVTVTARDGFGNAIAGQGVVLAVAGAGGSLTQPAATTNAGGATTGTFSSTFAGGHTISATVSGVLATQQPVVTVTPAAPAALNFVAAPSGQTAAGATLPAVQVEIRDAFANRVTTATSPVTIAIGTNPSAGTLSGALTVNAVSGLASFGPLSIDRAGTGYTLAATSGTLTGTLSSTFDVVPGTASVATSSVGVSASTVASGSGVTVTLRSRDASGNNLPLGGLTVAFTQGGGVSTGTFGPVTDVGDGTYTSTFTGLIAGTATSIGATIGGFAVTTALPTVAVTPGPVSLSQSLVTVSQPGVTSGGTSTITLTARDAAGNNLAAGGLTVVFAASGGSSTGTIAPSPATDNGNGTYTATFTGELVGTPLSIGATIGGNPVTSTAPTISVSPGLASAVTSVVTVQGGVTSIVSGQTFTAMLQARDASGNVIPTGGEGVAFSLAGGTSTAVAGATTDNNDGTYQAILTGANAGTASQVRATINGTLVTTAAPSMTVTPIAQTIAFGQPATPAVYGNQFVVGPTATSGLPVTVLATGGCTIASGTVTMTSGTADCVLTASQAGNLSFAPAFDVVRTVAAAPLAASVTPNAAGKIFGGADPALTGTLSGFLAADNVSALYARTAGEAVGTYVISATLSPPGVLSNYAITSNTAVFTIGQATQAISFTAPATPAAYGSSFGVAPTSSSGLAVTVTPSGGCTISAGTVTMTSGTVSCTLTASQAGDASYTAATDVVHIVAATQLAASVTPDASGKVFGAADPVLTGTLTGFLAADAVTATYARTIGESVGSYVISANLSPAGVLGNYTITFNTAAFDITQASQTITFAQPASPAAFGSQFAVAPTSTSGLTVTVLATGGCSIASGTVTMTSGTSDCVLTASQAGNADFTAALDVVRTVTAGLAAQVITFNQPTSPAAFGGQFAVAPTSTSGLLVSVLATGGCSITAGTVTMTSGTTDCVLTASQAGDANFGAAVDVVRTVAAGLAAQTITFAQPTSPAAFNSQFSVAPTASSGLAVSVLATGGCSISSGTVTMTSGTTDCVLTASQAGNADFSAASDVVRTVAASLTAQTITFAQPTSPAVFGSQFAVAPTSTSGLTVTVLATGGCSIASGTVTMTSGTTDCVLTASQTGDANYSPAVDVVRTVTAGLAAQTITFAQPTTPAEFNSQFVVAPTSSSGLLVSVLATGGCSITTGTVTMTSSTADCVLTASQAGDANYGPAVDVVRTVAASLAAQTITFAQPTSPAVFGSQFAVTPTSTSGLTVTVLATGGCSITTGTVTMTSGTTDCVLTASQAGDANYNPAVDVVRTVTASPAAQTITFAQPTTPAEFNSQFVVAPTASSGLLVSVLATGGCSITTGTVTMTSSTADCVLTASQAGDANYSPAVDVVRTVTASLAAQTITFTQPTTPAEFNSQFAVAPTSTSGLTVTVLATGGCSITTGTVTMTSGTTDCILTASQAGDANHNPAVDVVRTVTASLAAQTIIFAQPTSPAEFNSQFAIAPTASSGLLVSVLATGGCSITAGTVTMTSSTADCVLTASQAGDANYSPAVDVVRTVAASLAAQTITFAQPASPAVFGSQFAVAPTATSGLTVTVLAAGGCSIATGTVTMTSGTTDCVLTASQAGDANYNPAVDVVRTVTASLAAQTITFAQPTTPAEFNSQFVVAPTSTSGLTVTVLATGGCSITTGTVTMTSSTADCVLTASQAGDADYSPAVDVVRTVAASLAAQTITFAQPTSPAVFGSQFAVAPTSTSGLTVTVLATGGCSITTGTVTMTSGTTDCVLTASQAGDANYNPAVDVVRTVTASLAAQTITFAQPATPAVFNAQFAVGPTASSGLTVTVLASGGCSITTGTVTMTSGSTDCVLTASQAGDANYSAASDEVRTVVANRAAQAAVTVTVPPDDSIAASGLASVAGGGSGAGAFTYASTTLPVCTIDANTGAIAALTVGTCTITATRAADPDYLPETSAPQSFNVTAGAATSLIFSSQPPASAQAGSSFSDLIVTARDQNGNTATSFTGAVTLTATGGGGGALVGTASLPAVAGVATFPGLTVQTAGIGYTIDATAGGLTTATSNGFTITHGNANHLTFTAQPASTTADGTFGASLELRDAFDNVVTNFDADVILTIEPGTGTAGAALSGTTTITTSSGLVSFSGISIDSAGTNYRLHAHFNFGVVTAGVSSTFDISVGAAHHLTFVQQPTDVAFLSTITPPVTVAVVDQKGNRVTGHAGTVDMAIQNDPLGGTILFGTTNRAFVNGVATFDDLSLDGFGQGYTLRATSTSLIQIISAAFAVQ